MCTKCEVIVGFKPTYLFKVNDMWLTKTTGLVENINHPDLVKISNKSDAEKLCNELNLISKFKIIVKEHLYL